MRWVEPNRGGRVLFAALPAALALTTVSVGAAAEPATPDPLTELGWEVTGGAAPGYVDDEACEFCHDEIWASYQEVAMSRAFYRPSRDRVVEKLGQPFHHEPSGRYYVISFVGDTYRFERYQLDDAGQPINVITRDVDWILGSGNHSRTYLFRTPGGELFQLPLAWYGQSDSWGMSPGYDRPFHFGLQRMVRRECMFCHNAYPDVPAGSDTYDQPHLFPSELPTGLGCQRCHGPGARHARLALSGESEPDELLAAIVNPGKLEPQLRDDVCYGCHLQPSVSILGVRRFGRPDYSFRPGEPLADYMVQVDVVMAGLERSDRFEINHHPYRLEQSRCFAESGGELGCLTCHDPHRKVPAAERPAWYGARCLGCHDLDRTAAHADQEPGYCVPCHMPERRTQDVVRVTMTDHLIQRGPVGPELLAPLEEHDPVLLDLTFLDSEAAPEGDLGEIYRAAAVVRASSGGGAEAVAHLEEGLKRLPVEELEPWLSLAKGQLQQDRLGPLETTLDEILRRSPGQPLALQWLGVARARQGNRDEAIEALRRATASDVPRPEAFFNLGLLLAASGSYEEALEAIDRALEGRPIQSAAWLYKAKVLATLDRPREAAAAYRRALEIEPTMERAYVDLAETLTTLGDRAEALRYLRHGERAARDPRPVAEALEQAMANE